MRNWKKLIGVTCLCAIPLSTVDAQKVWIVDSANGPGTHFREIQDAIDAANAPDRILIRPGYYPGRLIIDKGISLVAVSGTIATSVIAFRNVPAGHAVALRGLDIGTHQPTYGEFGLIGTDCLGTISLSHCRVRSGKRVSSPGSRASGSLRRCALVSLHECDLDGGLGCGTTNLVASATRFAAKPEGAAVSISDARAELTNCSGQGGWYVLFSRRYERPAIFALKSHVTLRGDSGGYAGYGSLPAIQGSDSQAWIDPDVPLRAPAIGLGFGAVTRRELPDLAADGGALGQSVNLTVQHNPNTTYALYTGLPGAPLPVPGLGALWIEPTLLGRFATGTIGASGSAGTSHLIPATPNLAGLPLMYQGLTISSGAVDLTNGVGIVLAR